jgi:hypothetical protein
MSATLDCSHLLTKSDVRAFKWSVIRWSAAAYILQTVVICAIVIWHLP